MADLAGEITWFRGDSYPFELTIKDSVTLLAVDITGYSFLLTVDSTKAPVDDSTKVFEITGVLDADPTTGKVTFTPTTTNTNQVPTAYYYDVQMTDGAGNIRTIVKDVWKITQDITK
ncbi:MAG: hypothetical protein GY861_24555 [bacterium]|nr:hypothetical protein [bacterium]